MGKDARIKNARRAIVADPIKAAIPKGLRPRQWLKLFGLQMRELDRAYRLGDTGARALIRAGRQGGKRMVIA